jgi:hypothetical protein
MSLGDSKNPFNLNNSTNYINQEYSNNLQKPANLSNNKQVKFKNINYNSPCHHNSFNK